LLSIPGTEALSGPVKYFIAFTVIFALLALLALVLRRLTGGRLAMPAQERGRTRQPRLGIVDVYDLDRQRQLILLRRDNVEHLLLIGGPNDVIVETNIVRMGGARLPATPIEPSFERADALVDRSFETPPRPLVEPPGRAEPVVARLGPADATRTGPDGHLDDEALPLPVEPVLKPDVVALSPASAPRPSPPAREAVPVKPAQRVAPARAPQQHAEPPPPVRPVEPPARQIAAHARPVEPAGGDAAVMSDMARQLEDALKRPLAPTKGTAVAARPPNGPPPQVEEPVYQRRPQPAPKVAAPVAAPAPVAAAPAPAPRQAEPYEAQARARPTTVTRIRAAAEPETPKPAPQPEPTAPVRGAPAPQEQVDPFSVEEIEAEFARLLGRPLDRNDRANH
jgi:hypothetical protein